MTGAAGGEPGEGVEGAWLAVSDALLRGVGHAMNNRAAALSAVVQVLAATGPAGPLEEVLASETERLQRAVELLRLLPRDWQGEPEPVLVEDVVPGALALLALHADLPETRFEWSAEGALPPALVEPSVLTHALCLLGTAAAKEAARTGARAVAFRGSSSGDAVTVEITVGAAEEARADAAGAAETIDPAAAGPLLRRAGGELKVETEGGLRLTLTLPTLEAARRRAG